MKSDIYIGGTKLDQFKDESATVVSNVLDISNIEKNLGDYSKTFTVPASKNNNLLFKHWYNANIDNQFDARVKVDGRIDIDGMPFRIGAFRLAKVNVKNQRVSSYTINFFGNFVSLKDILGEDELKDLSFLDNYSHTFSYNNVKTGLQSSLFAGDVKYTLASGKRYYYNSNNSLDETPQMSNIDWDGISGGNSSNGVNYQDLRPSLRLIRIIEAIEQEYGSSQIVQLEVTVSTTNSFNSFCKITLNGVTYEIPVSSGTPTTNALQIRQYLEAFVPAYRVIQNGAILTITSVIGGLQSNPVFQQYTATDMVATFTVIKYGTDEEGLSFSREFFNTEEFQNLYLWCDDDATEGVGQLFRKVEFDTSTSPNISTTTNEGTFTLNAGDELKCNFIAERVMPSPLPTTATINYRSINIKLIINGVVYADVNRSYGWRFVQFGGFSELKAVFNSTFVPEVAGTYTAFFEITTNTSDIEQVEWFALINGTSTGSAIGTGATNNALPNFQFTDNMPEIKIIDFLKGLFDMYKLVVIAQDDGTLYINTLNNYYQEGVNYDLTNYINFDTYDANRGELLKEIEYKTVSPTTNLAIQFKENNNTPYGEEKVDLKDANGKPLDGGTLKVETPFEQPVYERLIDQNTGDLKDIQVAGIYDRDLNPVNPAPIIHYINNVTMPQFTSIKMRDEDEVGFEVAGNMNNISSDFPLSQPSYSVLFGSEFSTWDSTLITNTLYQNHWSDYISNIFNIKRRIWNYTANDLPLNIINNLQLNDVIKIRDNQYRINKFSVDLLNGNTTFELINAFDTIVIQMPKLIQLTSDEQTIRYEIANLQNYTIDLVSNGFGTFWINIPTVHWIKFPNRLDIEVDANQDVGAVPRSVFLILSLDGAEVQRTLITQSN
tara:strand:- start:2454 stop:5117 length:2664 start_codon:yes stop_codon:yes gene_type:complete